MMGAAGVDSKTYIEDVFSTYLYTGNGSSQTINNGIDLAGKGGMVWIKNRSQAYSPLLFDTVRQAPNSLTSVSTNPQANNATSLTSFTSSGFSVGSSLAVNDSSSSHVSWTFRKSAKFFDVVTYTGDGASTRDIAHSLGTAPGMIIVKNTGAASNWFVWHRSIDNNIIFLELTNAATATTGYYFGDISTQTASNFRILSDGGTNNSGNTYVAYLFAHDTTADGMIQCGSFTTDGSGNATVSLGWEPQWLLFKPSSTTGSWLVADSLRGLAVGSSAPVLQTNSSSAESNMSGTLSITPTGFSASSLFATSSTYIYIAIRRGPMKKPTDATTVFNTITATASTGTSRTVGFPADTYLARWRGTISSGYWQDRLRGFEDTSGTTTGKPTFGWPNNTNAETNNSFPASYQIWNTTAKDGGQYSGDSTIWYYLRRAPGFFDVVAGTAINSNNQRFSHNLGAAPELIIIKSRSVSGNWLIYAASQGRSKYHYFDSQSIYSYTNIWGTTDPSVTDFGLASNVIFSTNTTVIAYLFASCPGVSKVGSYTGTGTTLQINCGFTNGARFVLIKRTDSTGDWYVWDTARGIIAANDPYLLLNSSAAEVTNTDYIDPYAAGFEISSTAPAAINALNGSYIYLAIA